MSTTSTSLSACGERFKERQSSTAINIGKLAEFVAEISALPLRPMLKLSK
jgi:hypothetical protein